MSESPSPVPPTFVFTLPAPVAPAAAPERRRRGMNKALCLIGVGLLANAAVLLYTHITGSVLTIDRAAMAQAGVGGSGAAPMLGARGIYMMPAQLGAQAWGVYIMDVDAGTICVYRATPETSKFKLMAVRSFKWDVLLEDVNNETMTPQQVKTIIETQRKRQDLINRGETPTVEQAPKPDENAPDAPPAGGVPGPAAPAAPGAGVTFPDMPR